MSLPPFKLECAECDPDVMYCLEVDVSEQTTR